MGQVNASNAAMPAWLQISQNWGQPEQQLATDEYMRNYVNPAVNQQYGFDIRDGSANSTFAAGRQTSMLARGSRQAMLAGLDAKNAAINQKLNERSSYNSVPTDQGLAGRLYNNAQNAYSSNQQNSANRTANIIGAGAALAGYAAPAVGQFASGLWQGMKGQP